MKPEAEIDYDHPVAYDPAGRPLYYRPEPGDLKVSTSVKAKAKDKPTPVAKKSTDKTETAAAQPLTVTSSRTNIKQEVATEIASEGELLLDALDGKNQPISAAVSKRHQESAAKYPEINLAPSEYVVLRVRRHPIGWIQIWLVTLSVFAVLLISTILISSTLSAVGSTRPTIVAAGLILGSLTFIFGSIATHIYSLNRFYVTNERVVEHFQQSLFALRKQSIGLDRIEEISYRQDGMLQTILNFGTIRLATIGDETTYPYTYVDQPADQLTIINNTIQEFDQINGVRRPMKP